MTAHVQASFNILPGADAVIPLNQENLVGAGEIGIEAMGKLRRLKFLIRADGTNNVVSTLSEVALISLIGRSVSATCDNSSSAKGFAVRYISLPTESGYSGWRWPYHKFLGVVFGKHANKNYMIA